MSDRIYHGDEWKKADDDVEPGRTRMQEQAAVNELFAHGKITREEWSQRTDALANLHEWAADGKRRRKLKA